MRFACAVLCRLWPARLYNIFHIISYRARFSKDMLLNIKCVFWFSLQRLSETFFTLRKTERNMRENMYWSSCNVPLVMLDFLDKFSKNREISNLRKTRSLWAQLFYADGRTDGQRDRQTWLFVSVLQTRLELSWRNAIEYQFMAWINVSQGRKK